MANNLVSKLREFMAVYWGNLQQAQNIQKQAHDKDTKSRSHAPSNNIWLNSKYIKIKQNCKLEAKFFRSF